MDAEFRHFEISTCMVHMVADGDNILLNIKKDFKAFQGVQKSLSETYEGISKKGDISSIGVFRCFKAFRFQDAPGINGLFGSS